MDFEPAFFYLRLQGKVLGPFALAQLRELAEGGAITPATEASADAGGPWSPLQTLPMRVLLFAERSPFQPKEFERANVAGPPLDHRAVIAAASRPRAAGPAAATPPRPATGSPAHDVFALLRLNLATEKGRGLHELAPRPPKKSRRRRDYFVVLGCIGAAIYAVLLFEAVLAVSLQVMAAGMPDQFWPILHAVLFHSPILAWGLAAFFFYAVALGWLMFVVMDDH
jgi:hypothetical protein